MKTQKQFLENMQLMFQKHATATSGAQSSEPYRARTIEKDSNDTSQQESHNRDIPEKKTLLQVEKENVSTRMIKIVKIESLYTPQT